MLKARRDSYAAEVERLLGRGGSSVTVWESEETDDGVRLFGIGLEPGGRFEWEGWLGEGE